MIGNHQAFLISFLIHPPPEKIFVAPLALKREGKGDPIEHELLYPFNWYLGLNNWIRGNGGMMTIQSLVSCLESGGGALKVPPFPVSHREDLSNISSMKADMFHAARGVLRSSSICREFVKGLRPFMIDNGVVFVHASVPKIPFDDSVGIFPEIKRLYHSTITDPGASWCFGPGWSYFPTDYRDIPRSHREGMTMCSESYLGPLGDLIWARLPDGCLNPPDGSAKDRLSTWMGSDWIKPIKQSGISAIVRGHDTAQYLGAQTQSLVERKGIQILNCEAELHLPGSSGYTFIGSDGSVFCHQSDLSNSH